MAYKTDTQGTEANCAKVFSDMLVAYMAAHGWSAVETYTTGTQVAEVMKSASGDNGGVDYYVVIHRAADNSASLRLCLGETYDTGDHKLGKYVPHSTNAAPEATTFTWDSSGQVPNTANMAANKIDGCELIIAAAGFSYWISCNAKRLIVATRIVTSDFQVYAGMVENMLDETDHPSSAVALLLGTLGMNGNAGYPPSDYRNLTGMTREPGQASSDTPNFAIGCQTFNLAFGWPSLAGVNSANSIYDPDRYIATRIFGRSARGAVYTPRFLLPADCIAVPRPDSVHGDTVSIGAKTYVQMAVRMFVDDSV